MYLLVAAAAEFAGPELVKHNHETYVDEFLPQPEGAKGCMAPSKGGVVGTISKNHHLFRLLGTIQYLILRIGS